MSQRKRQHVKRGWPHASNALALIRTNDLSATCH
jgi:hypothetical protein